MVEDESEIGEQEQGGLFRIEGPDEDGCVWASSLPGDPAVWSVNLGPRRAAAEVMIGWLAQQDYGERPEDWKPE
jgi:hypothetical protein